MLSVAALLALAKAPPAAAQIAPTVGALVHSSRVFALPDDAVGYIPASAGPHPPLLVLLHGAGRQRLTMIQHFEAEADRRGIILLAPTSRGVTWDSVLNAEALPSPDSPLANEQAQRFTRTRDADRVETAIENLSRIAPVDRGHTVLAGFSDGATFALAMGMSRDHPFAAVIAWSPGIAINTERPVRGRRVFVSHGRQDPLLRFDVTCSEIVPLLQSEGAQVTFFPFNGVHEAPPSVKDAFLDAVFGPAAGRPPVPIPNESQACRTSPGTMGMQPS